MTTKTKQGGGIFVRDGRWLMQCGATAVPIRLLDKNDREIPPPPKKEETKEETNDRSNP